MIAVKTKFNAKELPDNLEEVRKNIERRIPLGAGAFNRKVTATAKARIDILKKKSKRDYEAIDNGFRKSLYRNLFG